MAKLTIKQIRERARDVILDHPDGIRFAKIAAQIQKSDPETNRKTLQTNIGLAVDDFSDSVVKVGRGLYRAVAAAPGEATTEVASEVATPSPAGDSDEPGASAPGDVADIDESHLGGEDEQRFGSRSERTRKRHEFVRLAWQKGYRLWYRPLNAPPLFPLATVEPAVGFSRLDVTAEMFKPLQESDPEAFEVLRNGTPEDLDIGPTVFGALERYLALLDETSAAGFSVSALASIANIARRRYTNLDGFINGEFALFPAMIKPGPVDFSKSRHFGLASPKGLRRAQNLLDRLEPAVEKESGERGGQEDPSSSGAVLPVALPHADTHHAGKEQEAAGTSLLLRDWVRSLQVPEVWRSFNIMLEGVPGTGKTYVLKQLRDIFQDATEMGRALLRGTGDGRFAMTLHPATSYEDVVEGLRPGPSPSLQDLLSAGMALHDDAGLRLPETPLVKRKQNASEESEVQHETVNGRWFFTRGQVAQVERAASSAAPAPTFEVHDGFFVSACLEAAWFPWCTFVVLLDEFNRCNIPKVMGDLLTTLERSKRATWVDTEATGFWDITDTQVVTLPYSKRLFFVPGNVIVVGTMNSTDRSVAPLDSALRRRFAFRRVWPVGFDPANPLPTAAVVDRVTSSVGTPGPSNRALLVASVSLWYRLNQSLLGRFGEDAMLGHSYLFDLARDLQQVANDEAQARLVTAAHWNFHLLPQLSDIVISNDLIDGVFANSTQESSLKLLDIDAEPLGPGSSFQATLHGSGIARVPTFRVMLSEQRPAQAPASSVPHAEADINSAPAGAITST